MNKKNQMRHKRQGLLNSEFCGLGRFSHAAAMRKQPQRREMCGVDNRITAQVLPRLMRPTPPFDSLCFLLLRKVITFSLLLLLLFCFLEKTVIDRRKTLVIISTPFPKICHDAVSDFFRGFHWKMRGERRERIALIR